jgi:hypothetical protein
MKCLFSNILNVCSPKFQMISFKKQRYFIHKTIRRKLFKMLINKCYFNQVKKLFLPLYIQLFYWYMHFLHILFILLLGTPSWSERCRMLIQNNSRDLHINNAFCCSWARSRSLAKKQLALSCLSVYLSVCPHVSAGYHWTILRKILYSRFLWKHLSTKSKFGYRLPEISGTLDEELGTFYCCQGH